MEPLIIWGIIIILLAILVFVLFNWYTIVPADFADVVIQSGQMRVFSSHPEYSKEGKSAYFKIPSWFFIFRLGMEVHRIPLKILTINVPDFLAFDKDRARFVCNIVAYVVVNSPTMAAKRFSGNLQELKEQVSKVVQATTRDATTKRPIREIINDREGIIESIKPPLTKALENWGLDLSDIELVEFRDPSKPEREGETASHVIADISSIIEEQINSEARQKNAEQKKIARLKEAEAEEKAKVREIQRDEEVAKRDQLKVMLVAEKEREAREKELDVVKVQQVKTQEIEKEKMIVEANQRKEIENINMEQKRLVGEGDRKMQEEQAKGEAAPILQKGLAEAEAKEALQAALNKFEDKAIRALVAEKVVEMQRDVGVAGAKALESADMKVFSGSKDDQSAFDVGKLLTSLTVSNQGGAESVLNRLARPNDLGIGNLDLKAGPAKKKKAQA